jgi:hypothetical protein
MKSYNSTFKNLKSQKKQTPLNSDIEKYLKVIMND